jgi:hypothetical protein
MKTAIRFALVSLFLSCTACPSMSTMVRMYGFAAVAAPNTFLMPGTVVMVQDVAPYTAQVICTAEQSLGPFYKASESKTTSTEVQKANGQEFDVGTDFLHMAHLKGKFCNIRSISAKLSNARLLELNDVDMYDNVRYRSPSCRRAIEGRANTKAKLTMIQSALMADAQYSVVYNHENSLSASANLEELEGLAAELGGAVSSKGSTHIEGENLIFGVRDDQFLLQSSTPSVDFHAKPGQRVLQAESESYTVAN